MKVFITRQIPEIAINLLINNGFDVIVFDRDKAITKKEIIKYGKDADGIISLLSDKFDSEIINSLEKCRVIANYAVGFNNIDLTAAKDKGIVITNTPDILTDATADIAMLLILACARNIIAGHHLVKGGQFKGWKPQLLLGVELRGKTFGIIGAGRIGTAVAKRAKAFGTNIIYYNHSTNNILEEKLQAKKVSLIKLMKDSDIVSIHLPLNEKTFHLIDRNKLNLLKKDAILINTARGEILDEKELINILRERKILAAGFDVYENEPIINKDLLKLKNVVLLPHIGSATVEARNKMAELSAKNVINVLKGKKPLTKVNF